MAKWSRAAKRRVRSYRAYKSRLKEYGREVGKTFKPMDYATYELKYKQREAEVESGERASIGNIASEIIRRENRPEVLYRDYKERLDKRVDYMINRGMTPDDALPLTYAEFNQAYAEYYSDFRKEMEKGERKAIGDVVGSMISDQVYKISNKQFKATYQAILDWNEAHPDRTIELGEGASITSVQYQMKMRTTEFDDSEWYDMIKEMRAELFAKGKSAREVRKEISKTFYGSP